MSTSDRPNILWISVEDTTPRFGCYGDTLARTPNIDRLAAGGCRFQMRFRLPASVHPAVPQSLPACTRLQSVHTTCEQGIQTKTHRRCRPRILQCHRLTSKLLPNTSEVLDTTARTIAKLTISLRHLSRHGMCVMTRVIGETVNPDNPSFRFSIQLLHTKVGCGNGRTVP